MFFQITVGRSTADNHVDVDLSLEGPAWKISRRQAVIKLRSDGEYCVINEGRRPLYIDGKPVALGTKARLHHNSTFEVIYRNSRVNKAYDEDDDVIYSFSYCRFVLSLFCSYHTKIILINILGKVVCNFIS